MCTFRALPLECMFHVYHDHLARCTCISCDVVRLSLPSQWNAETMPWTLPRMTRTKSLSQRVLDWSIYFDYATPRFQRYTYTKWRLQTTVKMKIRYLNQIQWQTFMYYAVKKGSHYVFAHCEWLWYLHGNVQEPIFNQPGTKTADSNR